MTLSCLVAARCFSAPPALQMWPNKGNNAELERICGPTARLLASFAHIFNMGLAVVPISHLEIWFPSVLIWTQSWAQFCCDLQPGLTSCLSMTPDPVHSDPRAPQLSHFINCAWWYWIEGLFLGSLKAKVLLSVHLLILLLTLAERLRVVLNPSRLSEISEWISSLHQECFQNLGRSRKWRNEVYNEEHGVKTCISIVEFSPAGQDF